MITQSEHEPNQAKGQSIITALPTTIIIAWTTLLLLAQRLCEEP
jgi:hypothetical protein